MSDHVHHLHTHQFCDEDRLLLGQLFKALGQPSQILFKNALPVHLLNDPQELALAAKAHKASTELAASVEAAQPPTT